MMDAAVIHVTCSRNLYPIQQELVAPESLYDIITEQNSADVSNKEERCSRTTDELIAEIFATSM